MLTKYATNKLIFIITTILFSINLGFFWVELDWYFKVLQFGLSTICLHYYCNLVHIASHQMLSKNRKLNHLLGWLSALPVLVFSFIDFKVTHTEHHKHPTDPNLDPDHKITATGHVLFLPLRIIFHKDSFFFKFAIKKHKWNWIKEYIFQRILQLGIFGIIVFQSAIFKDQTLFIFYLLPLMVVGLLNAMFLYYYPHYQNRPEKWFRKVVNTNSNNKLLQAIAWSILFPIDLCRTVHEAHHDKILNNFPYFPEVWMWRNNFLNIQQTSKYLEVNLKQNIKRISPVDFKLRS